MVAGFPHSGTHGSRLTYSSPWHFAVRHALHRLSVPRHPPYALSSLLASISRHARHRDGLLRLEIRVQAPALRSGPGSVIASSLDGPHGQPWGRTLTQLKLNSNSTLRMRLSKNADCNTRRQPEIHVELIGIEPTTSSLQSWRSPS